MNLPKLVQRGRHLWESGWQKEIGFKSVGARESAGTAAKGHKGDSVLAPGH